VCPHWLHFRSADGKEVVIVSGIVRFDTPEWKLEALPGEAPPPRIEFKGTGSSWRQETVKLVAPFPGILPPGKVSQVEHWAPVITLSGVSNQNHAVDAGWAVEWFGGPGPAKLDVTLPLDAKIAVRDIDGYVGELAYSVTLTGRFVPADIIG
jgi:hypothetical protein